VWVDEATVRCALPLLLVQASAERGQVVLALHFLVLLWWRRVRHHHGWLSVLSPPVDVSARLKYLRRSAAHVRFACRGAPGVYVCAAYIVSIRRE
jgi:hypothetical protein